MSPYDAYKPPYLSSRISSNSPSSTKYNNSVYNTYSPLNYRYKPSKYSSTLNSKYSSPSAYTSPVSYSTSSLGRQFSSLYLSSRVPRFTSVSSYASAISSSDQKWRSTADSTTESAWRRRPSFSSTRRDSASSLSSYLLDTSPRPSFSTYTSSADQQLSPSYSSRKSSLITSSTFADGGPNLGVGLTNLGNTCFMNSVLQSLSHTRPLVDYVLNQNFRRDINPRSPKKGEFIEALADFLKTMKNTQPNSTITPSALYRTVQKYTPMFSGYKQQDAQEFLKFLLEGVHDDLNRNSDFGSPKNDILIKDHVASWRKYMCKDNSIITDLFAGQLKNTVLCKSCGSTSYRYEPFWELSLSIPRQYSYSSLTLDECLRDFTSSEILDGSNQVYCETCKAKRKATKTMKIDRFPKILVIHIKRSSSTRSSHKVNVMIECPLNYRPDMEVLSDTCYGKAPTYNLYAVIDHEGTSYSGHYTAKCLNPETKTWAMYSDTRVSKATRPVSENSYMLFYIQEGTSFL